MQQLQTSKSGEDTLVHLYTCTLVQANPEYGRNKEANHEYGGNKEANHDNRVFRQADPEYGENKEANPEYGGNRQANNDFD